MNDIRKNNPESGVWSSESQQVVFSRSEVIRPTIRHMHGYVPGEQPQDKRYIKLNSNESPYPPSPQVIEALHRAVSEDLRLYPDPVANRLRDKAAAVYGLHRDQVLVGNGSDDLLT